MFVPAMKTTTTSMEITLAASRTRGAGFTRRQLFGISAAGIAGAVLVGGQPASAVGSAFGLAVPARRGGSASAVAGFTSPSAATAPRFRWWWPNGQVDLAEIAAEVEQAAENGFGGLEIANVHHSVAGDLLDVDEYGWGGEHWVSAVETALKAGDEHGIEIDMTLGPSWPAATPGITPNGDVALVELAHGVADVADGEAFSGALPEPAVEAEEGVTERSLVGVQALRVVERPEQPDRNGLKLEHASLVDLTARVEGDQLDWTAPAEGGTGAGWVVIAYWQRGSGQRPEAGPHTKEPSYVVDHFSAAGADALKAYWERNILTPRIRRLLERTGGTFFEDSLEVETDATIWAREATAEFSDRMGYELTPYLSAIVEQDEKYVFQYSDVNAMRVRDDYNQVLSDLYSEKHLVPLRDWAHGYGLRYRVQAYGLEQDSIEQAGIVDIPETESLGAKNLDDYRVLASGRDIGGNTLLSCEAAAYLGKAYAVTWRDVLETLGQTYVGGVNQNVLHGLSYRDAPGAQWPGFGAFTPYSNDTSVGYSEAWGVRMPSWEHMHDAADYLARTQWVLRQGHPHYDVAFLRQKGWAQTGMGATWATSQGIPTGWTHGFLNESSLFQERATLVDGVFAPEGGAYRAFVIGPDLFRGNEATMSLRTADKLRELAHGGLKLVFFGDWSSPEAIGLRDDQTNTEVAAIIEQLRGMAGIVAFVDPAGDNNVGIPAALADLGVRPRASHENSHVKHVHRVDGDIDYFYVANVRHNFQKDKLVDVDQELTLAPSRSDHVPYLLDAWSGAVSRLGAYERRSGNVVIRLRLRPSQSLIVVLAPEGWAGTARPKATIDSLAVAGSDVSESGSVFLHTDRAGKHRVPLAGRGARTVVVPSIAEPVSIDSWSVVVSDWQPAHPGEATPTDYPKNAGAAVAVDTVKREHRFRLDRLVPWSQLPDVSDASGIGTYSSTFTLGHDFHPVKAGARLELGEVSDTFVVWINGDRVDERDLVDSTIDITAYVRRGENRIRVEVATPLNNRMRVARPEVYGGQGKQDYGLIGPVTVTPYGRTKVA